MGAAEAEWIGVMRFFKPRFTRMITDLLNTNFLVFCWTIVNSARSLFLPIRVYLCPSV